MDGLDNATSFQNMPSHRGDFHIVQQDNQLHCVNAEIYLAYIESTRKYSKLTQSCLCVPLGMQTSALLQTVNYLERHVRQQLVNRKQQHRVKWNIIDGLGERGGAGGGRVGRGGGREIPPKFLPNRIWPQSQSLPKS
jgi:hypothetical protein